MKDILNENDLVRIDQIKNTIKQKDIRTHSQLKAEFAKNGLDIQIKKDLNGNVKSYSITDKSTLKMDSTKGKDRAFMKEFDDLIKQNRDKAIEKAREPDSKDRKLSEVERKYNKSLETSLQKAQGKGKSEIEM